MPHSAVAHANGFTMLRFGMVVLALTLGHPHAGAQGPEASAPDSYMTDAEIQAVIQKELEAGETMAVGRVSLTEHYRINLSHRTQPGGALAHQIGTEVHHITGGAGTL